MTPNDRITADEIAELREKLHSQFAATFAKLREELGPHLGAGGGLAAILDGISSLRASNEQLRRDYQEQSAGLVAMRASRNALVAVVLECERRLADAANDAAKTH